MSINKLFYSNDCGHSTQILSFIRDNGLLDRFAYICIDNRYIDPRTNTLSAILKNGQVVPIPIHITRVPALLILDDPVNKNVAIIGFKAISAKYGRVIETNDGEPQPANSAASGLGGSAFSSPTVLSPMLPQNNSGNRIKEGDITTEELVAKRKREEADIIGAM